MPSTTKLRSAIQNAKAMQAEGLPVSVIEFGGVKYHLSDQAHDLTGDPVLRRLLAKAEAKGNENDSENTIRRTTPTKARR